MVVTEESSGISVSDPVTWEDIKYGVQYLNTREERDEAIEKGLRLRRLEARNILNQRAIAAEQAAADARLAYLRRKGADVADSVQREASVRQQEPRRATEVGNPPTDSTPTVSVDPDPLPARQGGLISEARKRIKAAGENKLRRSQQYDGRRERTVRKNMRKWGVSYEEADRRTQRRWINPEKRSQR